VDHPLITVVGGSGFLGRYVIRRLVQSGYRVKVLCRDTIVAQSLKPMGDVGQIAIEYADITTPETLKSKLKGSFAVINLVGILYESSGQSFKTVQTTGLEQLAEEAKRCGVKRFIHVSALGVDQCESSHYARSKMAGENSLRKIWPKATILRPSVIFGPEDNFFNKFAQIASISPALPAIGGGHTKFQPIYVDDVALAILHALENPKSQGQLYELGGPEVISFGNLLRYIAASINRMRCLISVPFLVARLLGRLMQLLPKPPLTADQVQLLKHDNVVSQSALTIQHLGITPVSFRAIVPRYLSYLKSN